MDRSHKWIRIAAYLFVLASASAAVAADNWPATWFHGNEQQRARHHELMGKPAPRLTATNWQNGNIGAGDLAGKIVVVKFWATWCGPCLASIPADNAMYEKYRDQGVVVIGICGSSSGQDRMVEVAKARNIRYPIAADSTQESAAAWRVMWWPTYGVVDRNGTLRGIGLTSSGSVQLMVRKLLEEQPLPVKTESDAEDAEAQDPAGGLPEIWRTGNDERRQQLFALEQQPTPALTLSDWLHSEPLKLDDLRGKVVLLHFWTMKPAAGGRGLLLRHQLHRKYADEGLVVIGIYAGDDDDDEGDDGDDEDMMKITAARRGVEHPLARDVDGQTAKQYRVARHPEFHLIGRNGRLRVADIGERWLNIAIRRLLREDVKPEQSESKSQEASESAESAEPNQDSPAEPTAPAAEEKPRRRGSSSFFD